MTISWAPVNGVFQFEGEKIVFVGGPATYGGEPGVAIGQAMSNQSFSGGTISAEFTFAGVEAKAACDIVLWYHPERRIFVSAGLATDPSPLFGIRHFDAGWHAHAAVGIGTNLQANRKYRLQVQLRGSRVSLFVDGVQVAAATLPFSLSPSQVGIWCRGLSNVTIEKYEVVSETPRVFVVMQFGSPFDDLHREVLKTVCKEFGLDAIRADETYGPGLIVADIEKQIDESKFIIAEITPANPNVYYEVGYARAKNKPTILLADKAVQKLPFDLSPFRTLFYENSIAGKTLVEEGLRRHIRAVLSQASF